jgi:hypothetical protein
VIEKFEELVEELVCLADLLDENDEVATDEEAKAWLQIMRAKIVTLYTKVDSVLELVSES